MKQESRLKWISVPLVLGGLLWVVGGLVLAGRPGGHPPHSFRATQDVMPLLGLGLFLIAGSLGVQCLVLPPRGERSFYIAATFFFIGALFYPAGIMVRTSFLDGAWEPLMPLGFLLVVAGGLLYGKAALATKLFSRPVSVLLLLAALLLPGFNDQYLPWMGSVFGTVVTVYAYVSRLGYKKPVTGDL